MNFIKSLTATEKVIGLVFCLLVLSPLTMVPFYYSSIDTVTVVVTEKERVVENTGESVTSKYLVFTDEEVFENSDSLMFFKFNSSDIYGELKVGETYTVDVVGWRVPFLSMYRNIIGVENE